jgi:hypothetical protein
MGILRSKHQWVHSMVRVHCLVHSLCSVSSYGRRDKESLRCFFYKDLNPIQEYCPLVAQPLLKSSNPNTIILRVRISTCEFGGHKYSVCSMERVTKTEILQQLILFLSLPVPLPVTLFEQQSGILVPPLGIRGPKANYLTFLCPVFSSLK